MEPFVWEQKVSTMINSATPPSNVSKSLPAIPEWRTLDEARRNVEEVLRAFLAQCDGREEEGPARALALRVTVGVGKSATLRSLLATSAHRLLLGGHILVFVPTHALAEEAEAAFRTLNTGIPSMVLRGRDAKDPATGASMCIKGDLASRIAQVSWSVGSALCQAEDAATGEFVRSICRRGCAWYEQLPGEETRIIFLPHAYLKSRVPPSIEERVALRIIDEQFLGAITGVQSIFVDGWLTACSCASLACIHEARRLVHEALLRRRPVIGTLVAAGYKRVMLKHFHALEVDDQPELLVTPRMGTSEQRAAVEAFDYSAFFAARARARLWDMLHEDWPLSVTERISLGSEPSNQGPPRSVIRLHSRGDVPRSAPLILLDADADPLVTETLVPGARFVSIDVRPNAEVIQVEDKTFSTAALLTRPDAAERRREILDLVEREAANSRTGVLLVATTAVLRALHQDEDPERDLSDGAALLRPIRGAHPRWFGPSMQGVNTYEDFDTVIIVGRMQPAIEAIEDEMRAIFGNGDVPLAFVAPDDPKRGWYAPTHSAHLVRGEAVPAIVRSHPDSRGAALLGLVREAATIQAIGRIRAVKPGPMKRILVLSSLVLPGLPVDRLVLWQELVTGHSRLELSAKSQKLESAVYPNGSRWPVTGLRLSAAGIAADAPEVFQKPNSATGWRRDLPTEKIFEMILAMARRRGGLPQFVWLRRSSGGRRTPAVLVNQGHDLAGAVARHWPGLELMSSEDGTEQHC